MEVTLIAKEIIEVAPVEKAVFTVANITATIPGPQGPPGEAGTTLTDTDDLSEGSTNLYYTNERVDTRIQSKSASDLTNGVIGTGSILLDSMATNRQTTSYTLVLADRGKMIESNVASANNITVPLNSSVAFPVGTQILLVQYGTGQVTVVATSGVTIRSTGAKLKLTGQYSSATLLKIGTNEWYLLGDITA